MIRYPIGIQTFSEVVEGEYRYIDKTGYVYNLAQRYKYVFLSRPRRFGKSLLVSTFHSYFNGDKHLFEHLEAGRLETEWTKHPVLHFDMSTAKHADAEQLLSELNIKLREYENIYGANEHERGVNLRLYGLIRRAYEQTGKRVVVLIDDYDAPLIDTLDDEEGLRRKRLIMRNFFSPIKSCDPYLRFFFMTAIARYPSDFINSELNNMCDISLSAAIPPYAEYPKMNYLRSFPRI